MVGAARYGDATISGHAPGETAHGRRRWREPERFGIFLAPFHPVGQNPTLALQRDLELIEHLDRLGFDEAWIGEHHSAGLRDHRLARGVHRRRGRAHPAASASAPACRSLPYHHPLMLADRMVLLDHLTAGPGHARRRPGRAAVRRLHDGHRRRPAAGHDGGVARGDPRACSGRTSRSTMRDRLVHAPRRPPAAAALHPAPLRGGGGRPGVAGRAPGRRPVRLRAAVDRRHQRRRASTSSATTGTSWRSGPPSSAPPSTGGLAARRPDAHRRDQGAGRAPTSSSAWPTGSTTSSGWRRCRWRPTPRTTTTSSTR